MKTELKLYKTIELREVETGECFKWGDEIFIKTTAVEYNADGGIAFIKCVKLETGELYSLYPYRIVDALNLKVVKIEKHD